jgi:aconitase B
MELLCDSTPYEVLWHMGRGADVFLASAELDAVSAVMGKLPTVEEYMAYATKIDSMRRRSTSISIRQDG